MSGELTTLIVSGLVAAVSAPVGAWVSSKILRQKYNLELGQLRAEMESKLSAVKKSELDNVREASDILMDNVVKPLKTEIQSLRRDVNKFRRAIEKIPTCPIADTCPVSRELLDDEDGTEQSKSKS